MTGTNGLVEFIKARLADDERTANTMAEHYPPPWDLTDRGWLARVTADEPHFRDVVRVEQQHLPEGIEYIGDVIAHVARHDPARVARDVAAARGILAVHHPDDGPHGDGHCVGCHASWHEEPWTANVDDCPTLRALALSWDDHDHYREEWRP